MEKMKPVSYKADYFKKLIEDANVIIFRMALPAGKFEYVSPACLEITGYEPQEFYDNPLLLKNSFILNGKPFLNSGSMKS